MLSTALLSLLVVAAPQPARPRLAVLALKSVGDVNPGFAEAMTEAISAEIGARQFFDPISSAEITTLLGMERQKQLLGCGEEAASCMTEIAAALGAPYVLSGSLTRLEGIFQLNLQVLDSQRGRTVARSTKIARDFEGLRSLIPYAVAEASGTPLPTPPSKVLPVSLLIGGGLGIAAGGVLGLLALNEESAVRGELASDDTNPTVVLAPTERFRGRLEQTALQRTLALTCLLSGAALVGLGIVLFPPDAPQPGVRVSLMPTLGGAAIGGTFP